jgi:drug/metabolite transporter (DMT)-like permease
VIIKRQKLKNLGKVNNKGVLAALGSALFLGLAPIFGKQAILLGFSPLAVVALRTSMATALIFLILVVFKRPFLYIYPAGLLGCFLAGAINGVGSLLYYMALARLSVSVGQLLYSLYPVFLIIWFLIDRQAPYWLTYIRLILSMGGVILLTSAGGALTDWTGILLVLGASALYALHLPINQRVLYDIPAPTVTLYTLLSMSVVTLLAFFLFDRQYPSLDFLWGPIIGLTLVTFLSRLTLFVGIKHVGGIQTALLGLSELVVSLIVSSIWLGDTLLPIQWIGALLLLISILLIAFDKIRPEQRRSTGGLLDWLRPP